MVNEKLTKENISTIELSFYMMFESGEVQPPLKPNGHKFKRIDFCKRMGTIYGVHWKTIDGVLRK